MNIQDFANVKSIYSSTWQKDIYQIKHDNIVLWEIDDFMPFDEIWYTSTDGNIVTPYRWTNIVSNTYQDGKGVIKFSSVIRTLPYQCFQSETRLQSIRIPDGVTSINESALRYSNLNSITWKNVTSLGQEAFSQCNRLRSIDLHGIRSIGIKAFQYAGLTSVTIPSSVTSVGWGAFQGCQNLTSVVCEPTTPPTTSYDGVYMFDSTNDCPIYVPASSVDAYKAATGWSDYASRIQAIQ